MRRAWTKNDREERIPSWKNNPRMKGPCVAEVMVRTEKLLFDLLAKKFLETFEIS